MSGDEGTRNEAAIVLRAAIDKGIADLDAGLGEEPNIEDLMAEVTREVGLDA
jgi:hypothetical protein